MAIKASWRNQYTALEAKRAKAKPLKKCQICGNGIPSTKRRYCGPCSDVVHVRTQQEAYYKKFKRG